MSKRDNKRIGNITPEQKSLMLEFLEAHPELVSAKFTSTFTFKSAQILWQELAEVLNAVPGSRKDWSQWRKTWHDVCTSTKAKTAAIYRSTTKTGGGPPSAEQLTPSEAHCAKLIGSITIHGDPTTEESAVTFSFDDPIDEDFSDVQLRTLTGVDSENDESICILAQSQSTIPHQASYEKPPPPRINELIIRQPSESASVTRKRVTSSSGSFISPRTRPYNAKSRRLEETIECTRAMMASTATELEVRSEYYKRKLELLQRDVVAKEKIAEAITISCNLKNTDENDMIEEYLDERLF